MAHRACELIRFITINHEATKMARTSSQSAHAQAAHHVSLGKQAKVTLRVEAGAT